MAASGDPTLPLQEAMYNRLNGDATLTTTLGVAVYDEPPVGASGAPNPSYPYVQIGDVTAVPDDTMGKTARDVTVTIHTWSRKRGMKQVKQIQNRLDLLLDRWAPTVTGWAATEMLNEFFETFRDADGITKHGVARYRITISAT